jgi:hypothetical protein
VKLKCIADEVQKLQPVCVSLEFVPGSLRPHCLRCFLERWQPQSAARHSMGNQQGTSQVGLRDAGCARIGVD